MTRSYVDVDLVVDVVVDLDLDGPDDSSTLPMTTIRTIHWTDGAPTATLTSVTTADLLWSAPLHRNHRSLGP